MRLTIKKDDNDPPVVISLKEDCDGCILVFANNIEIIRITKHGKIARIVHGDKSTIENLGFKTRYNSSLGAYEVMEAGDVS